MNIESASSREVLQTRPIGKDEVRRHHQENEVEEHQADGEKSAEGRSECVQWICVVIRRCPVKECISGLMQECDVLLVVVE